MIRLCKHCATLLFLSIIRHFFFFLNSGRKEPIVRTSDTIARISASHASFRAFSTLAIWSGWCLINAVLAVVALVLGSKQA
ncbi:hypothetical protein DWV97_05895 [Ruminococcus sp. AF14-10]|nr:hypothetical protein DWV97_05895 [Ruminococcus sp. AF14-10]